MSGTERNDGDLEVPGLAHLEREIEPPPALEERTVEALRRRGMLREPGWTAPVGLLLLRGAALVALLLVGLVLGRWSTSGVVSSAKPGFVLLLRGGPAAARPAMEAEMLRRVEEYSVWARRAQRAGHLLGGEKLTDTGRLLAGQMPAAGEPRPFVEEGEIQGYFLLGNMSRAEAARVAAECPHLRYGGTIELREIERFDQVSLRPG